MNIEDETFPILYKMTAINKLRLYIVEVEDDTVKEYSYYEGSEPNKPTINVYGVVNKDKKNEKSPHETAIVKAKSRFKKKLDSGYQISRDDAMGLNTSNKPLLKNPMLAHPYKDSKQLKGNQCIQVKSDGIRGMALFDDDIADDDDTDIDNKPRRGKIVILSRKQKKYTSLPHINAILLELYKDIIVNNPEWRGFDGELYVHKMPLQEQQEIISPIKGVHPLSTKVVYYLFDGIDDETKSFKDRYGILCNAMKDGKYDNTAIRLVPYYLISNHLSNEEKHEYVTMMRDKWISQGYEGAIIRDLNSVYKGFRTASLLKYKVMVDEEAEIIDTDIQKGNRKGAIKFKVRNGDNQEYSVTMKDISVEKLREMYKRKDDYIGQIVTVELQDYYNSGKPRFGVIKCFRNPEDE